MLQMRLPAYGSPQIYAMVLHPAVSDETLPSLTSQIAGMDLATSEAMCGEWGSPLGGRVSQRLCHPLAQADRRGLRRVVSVAADPSAAAVVVGAPAFDPGGAVRDLGVARLEECRLVVGNGEWLLVQQGAFTLTSTAAKIDQIGYVTGRKGCFRVPTRSSRWPCRLPRAEGRVWSAGSSASSAGRSTPRSCESRRGRNGRRENRDLERFRAIAAPSTDLGIVEHRPPAYCSSRKRATHSSVRSSASFTVRGSGRVRSGGGETPSQRSSARSSPRSGG